MKILTDFRKTVETGMDPHLIFTDRTVIGTHECHSASWPGQLVGSNLYYSA